MTKTKRLVTPGSSAGSRLTSDDNSGYRNIPASRVIPELTKQGFRVSVRDGTHWYVYPPAESGHASFGLAASGQGARHQAYIPRDGWKKLRGAGFIWPPPGRENDSDYRAPDVAELEVLESPDGREYKPIDFVNASDEELGIAAQAEAQQLADDFRLIDLEVLRFDKYQRNVSPNPAINNRFNVTAAGCIYVSERKDHLGLVSYWCIDGQHRVKGAIGAGVKRLPALIYKGLTYDQEAKLFYILNNDRKAVTPGQLFKARIEAKDPVALAVKRDVEMHSFTIAYTSSYAPDHINAVRSLEHLHRWGVLARTLKVLKGVWWGEPDVVTEPFLTGVGALFKAFPSLDADQMISRLKAVKIEKILREAQRMRYEIGGGLWQHVARAVMKEYNRGRAAKLDRFVPPKLPLARMDEEVAEIVGGGAGQ